MKRITVFCGSSGGNQANYRLQAAALGRILAEQHIELVYGGSKVGLMGAVADGVLAAGGKVIGVLPRFLKTKELAHEDLTELILVDSMHERKTKMSELCDGVIALPGGFGTLDELFEMLTWGQLGIHKKPVALLNIDGFYDPLTAMVRTMVDEGFLKEADQKMVLISAEAEDLLNKMRRYVAPTGGKWIGKDTL